MPRRHTWLIAYDIADPGRLRRVHGLLSRKAQAVQYSVFATVMSDAEIERLLAALARLIDEDRDDVRAWRITPRTRVRLMGRGALMDGVWLNVPNVSRLLEPGGRTEAEDGS